jgi:hypothetical protein
LECACGLPLVLNTLDAALSRFMRCHIFAIEQRIQMDRDNVDEARKMEEEQ